MTWRRTVVLALGLALGSFAATFALLVGFGEARAYHLWRNQ